ncbi:MAG: alpha/beta hydrolase [Phycisphaerae bacterium]
MAIAIAVALAASYGVLLLMAALLADRMLFPAPASSYTDSAAILKLKTADGVTISAAYLKNHDARYTILFSHGNGEDIGRDWGAWEQLRDAGFSVFAYDYHGYGTSGGSPSEQAAYADIDAAYDYLTGPLAVPPGRIIVYGRSVGSGPSVDLASRRPVGGLVLEAAFTSAFRIVMLGALMPWDKFCNIDKIGKVSCPVLVIHGRRDAIVPFSHGQRLYTAAGGPKRCLWLDEAGHNDCLLAAGPEYYQALRELAALADWRPEGNEKSGIPE